MKTDLPVKPDKQEQTHENPYDRMLRRLREDNEYKQQPVKQPVGPEDQDEGEEDYPE